MIGEHGIISDKFVNVHEAKTRLYQASPAKKKHSEHFLAS
jgi:hypothetical protein